VKKGLKKKKKDSRTDRQRDKKGEGKRFVAEKEKTIV